MVRKYKKVVVISILCVLLTAVTLSACKDNSNKKFYDVTYFDYPQVASGFDVSNNATKIINTLESLKAFCPDAFDTDNSEYDNELYEKFRSYDEKFFKKNSLVIFCKTHYSGYHSYEFSNLGVEGNVLRINILDHTPYTGYDPIVTTRHVWVIEIDKDSIKNVENTKVNYYRVSQKWKP